MKSVLYFVIFAASEILFNSCNSAPLISREPRVAQPLIVTADPTTAPTPSPAPMHSSCYAQICSAVALDEGSGDEESSNTTSSNGSLYMLEVKTEAGLNTGRNGIVEVKLKFANCIPFTGYDQKVGPKFYKIESVLESTGEASGEFIYVPYNSEAHQCQENVVTFETSHPAVFDLPRVYRWTPTVKESICFKASILHSPDNSCETITKCIPAEELPTISEPSVPSPTLETVYLPYVKLPDAKTQKRCDRIFNCSKEEFKDIPFCGCIDKTNCQTFPKKCEIRKLECLYKGVKYDKKRGECPTVISAPPTLAPPTSAPPIPPVVGECAKGMGRFRKFACTDAGDYKRAQCWMDPALETGYYCSCVTYGYGSAIVGKGKHITTCDSPDTLHLNCFR